LHAIRAWSIFINPGDLEGYGGLIWLRGGHEDSDVVGHHAMQVLNEKSLAPLLDHGDKRYMVALKMAEFPHPTYAEALDFSQPFCVKPLVGSKGRSVHIWIPKESGAGVDARKSGGATKSQVLRAINDISCILQPFIPPGIEVDENGQNWYKLMRLFAVMKESGDYELIPSAYVMRPNLKIHGASDAINGLISFE
jgi:hypothetical protein